jgi:acetyltransferase
MHIDEVRSTLRDVIASIAPECDVGSIRADRPLREQVDLDSLDWINLVAGLHERLRIDIPEADHAQLATLDAIVAYVAARSVPDSAAPAAATVPAAAGRPAARHRIDGVAIAVRPIRPDDAPLEADFVRHLSDESRYKRFMHTLRELPEGKLRYLTEVDGTRHVALVATTERDGGEAILGVARYIVDPDGEGCEFAVAVDDAWHGKGVAGILMHSLIDVARAHGLRRMEAVVLAGNRKMLKFARQLGFSLQREPDDPLTVHARRTL